MFKKNQSDQATDVERYYTDHENLLKKYCTHLSSYTVK